MLASRIKRLGELERQIGANHQQATDKYLVAVWAQFSDEQVAAMVENIERRARHGYVLTAEDKAIEQHWNEVVQSIVPQAELDYISRMDWALAWCEAVRKHG